MSMRVSKCLVYCFIPMFFLLWGCSTSKTERPKTERNNSNEKYPITLYITKDGSVDPLNVNITIDRDTIIDQDFSDPSKSRADTLKMGKLSFMSAAPPPNWQFKFTLTGGDHRVVATSRNGGASLDSVFSVNSKKWLVLFYGPEKNFRLQISNNPVVLQ